MHMAWLTVWCPCSFFCQLIFKISPTVTGMLWDNPEVCTKPAPCLAFTIPGNILNASLWSSSIHDVGCWGIGISGILLCCSWTFSRIACHFSSRVERYLISSVWDWISLACHKCNWDKTETRVQWAISSSTILANKVSFPWRACVSAYSGCDEALCWANSCCYPWALSTLCPMPSSMLLNESVCRALAWEGLDSSFSGFMMAYRRCITNIPSTYIQSGKFFECQLS